MYVPGAQTTILVPYIVRKRILICATLCVAVWAGAPALVGARIPKQNPSLASTRGAGQISATGSAPSSAQNQTAQWPWDDPSLAGFVYDVVSIKPYKNGGVTNGTNLGTMDTPDGFSAAFPVAGLIYTAWYTPKYRIVGAFGWMNSENYDVKAKMSPETLEAFQKLSPKMKYAATQHMLQVLLKDRFKAIVHVEPRKIPAYDLVIGKNGPKLSQAAELVQGGSNIRITPSDTTYELIGRGALLRSLAVTLSNEVDRPVIDKTGLTGAYDFNLDYTPQKILMAADGGDSAPLKATGPPIEKAIEAQLGLKLVPSHTMVNDIVIDHVERPTPN
jgi:uncharacterized protein (TIGR03435 family)